MNVQQLEDKRQRNAYDSSQIAQEVQDAYFYEQVTRYRTWLKQQMQRAKSPSEKHIADTYATNASQVVVVGKQSVQAYAPFRYKYSALKVVTGKQYIILVILLLAWIEGMIYYGRQILTVTMTIITLAYLLHLILDVMLALSTVR